MREQRFIDGVDGRRVGKRSKGKRIFEESPAQMLGNQRHETVVGGKLVEDIVGDKKAPALQNHGYPGGAADLCRRPEIPDSPYVRSDDSEYRTCL